MAGTHDGGGDQQGGRRRINPGPGQTEDQGGGQSDENQAEGLAGRSPRGDLDGVAGQEGVQSGGVEFHARVDVIIRGGLQIHQARRRTAHEDHPPLQGFRGHGAAQHFRRAEIGIGSARPEERQTQSPPRGHRGGIFPHLNRFQAIEPGHQGEPAGSQSQHQGPQRQGGLKFRPQLNDQGHLPHHPIRIRGGVEEPQRGLSSKQGQRQHSGRGRRQV